MIFPRDGRTIVAEVADLVRTAALAGHAAAGRARAVSTTSSAPSPPRTSEPPLAAA